MDEHVSTIDLLPRRSLARAQGPLYRQLAEILREPIASGAFPVGGELPKEAVLAEKFGVSLITVRQALRELEAGGLIKKRSAKPAIVTAAAPPVTLSWTFNNFNDMAAFTKDAELRIKSYKLESSPVLEQHFGLAKGKKSHCLRSVLAVGKQRKAQITTFFPPAIGSQLKKEDFNDALIFMAVQRRLNIRMVVAHCTVRAEIADKAVAADLGVEVGS